MRHLRGIRWISLHLLIVTGAIVPLYAQTTTTTTTTVTKQEPTVAARIKRVFINVHPDTKAAHRMWTYLNFELEDRDFVIVGSEKDADAIVDVKLEDQHSEDHISVGVMQMRFNSGSQETEEQECASVGHGGSMDMFERSGEVAAETVKKRFPEAKTIRLDSSSDMSASDRFRADFEDALKKQGFRLVSDDHADVLLRINLTVEKVPLEEQTMQYHLEASTRDQPMWYTADGERVVSAKLKTAPPKVCPDRFNDLDWISGSENPLFETAESLAKALKKKTSHTNSQTVQHQIQKK